MKEEKVETGKTCERCGFNLTLGIVICNNYNQLKPAEQNGIATTHFCPNPRTDGSCGCYRQWINY